MPAHERLHAWKACHDLAIAIFQTTDNWPEGKRFGVTAQVRRAAWSAAASIAEGSAKRGPREFARYLDIANGSIAEVRYGVRLAIDLGLVSTEEARLLQERVTTASRLTFGLYACMRRKSKVPQSK